MKNRLKSVVSFQTSFMTSGVCLISQKVATYLYVLMEVVGFRTRGRLYRGSLTVMGLTLTTWQHSLSTDRQRVKGYLLKWREARILFGSALYVDILKPASLLSLTLQSNDIDIVQGIKHILKSHSTLQKLSSQQPLEWPVTKLVLSRLRDEHGGKVYQGSALNHCNALTTGSCKDQALADLNSLDEKMRSRFEWSDVEMLRSIILFLDTELAMLRGNFE